MPLLKRRRVSDCARPCDATRFGGLQRSVLKKLWFHDGDIVHRKRLQCSMIFSDMLHIPQPSETDQIDGCPSVTLVGDALTDWEVALGWMYDIDDFLRKAITFDVLSGALRISYEIADLHALPHAAEAINLAQECNVPEILPSCFYVLSVQKFHCSADGASCSALQDALVRIIIDPLAEPGCYNNASCGQCAPWRLEYWRTRLAPDPKSPWSTWLARELVQMLNDDAFVNTLCSDFVHGHLSTIRWRLGRLRGAISSFYYKSPGL
ncbi:hypothetical protein K438DRAFT_1906690 [Mycena galopus ATCC 62051]|nr:hypothetical protein K438DRAFT_1906690 [Mycena galopus ATCC 62051]